MNCENSLRQSAEWKHGLYLTHNNLYYLLYFAFPHFSSLIQVLIQPQSIFYLTRNTDKSKKKLFWILSFFPSCLFIVYNFEAKTILSQKFSHSLYFTLYSKAKMGKFSLFMLLVKILCYNTKVTS